MEKAGLVALRSRMEAAGTWELIGETGYFSEIHSFSKCFEYGSHELLEPIMDSMKNNTRFYLTDFLLDVDFTKKVLDAIPSFFVEFDDDEPVYFYGVRDSGCDHPEYIACNTLGDPAKWNTYYSDVFMLCISNHMRIYDEPCLKMFRLNWNNK